MKYYNFYEKYVDFPSEFSEGATHSLQAPSPFGDGGDEMLEIASDGTFTCKATGKTGSPTDFIKALYPRVSDLGAKLIVSEDNRLRHRQLQQADDLIDSFRRDEPLVKIAASKLGLSAKQLTKMPVFMDKRGFRYHYVTDYSPSGTPLTLATFNQDNPLRITQGVARPPEITSQRIWMTDNPVTASLVEEYTGETAMCWPKQRELEIFDYKEIIDGKDVVVLHGELTFPYEESFYPFFENSRRCVNSIAVVRHEALSEGQQFASWIAKEKNLELLEMYARISQNLQPITKTHYETYILSDDVMDVQYAQSSARGYFFYGTGEGFITQSWPLSIDSEKQTMKNFNLRFIQPTRFKGDIRLSPDRVLSIGQSVSQFTPRNTFNLNRGILSHYIYFDQTEMETLLSLWMMGTYVFSLFPAFPYLHINAIKNSGKTTLLELIVKCSFNGIMASRITPANLIHTVSDTQCTLCLDEFEQGTGGQGGAHTQILNSGYKRGGNYRRLRGANTDVLDLYSPKVYASVDAIKSDTLASRTLRIDMHRKPKHEPIKSWDDVDPIIKKRANEIISGGYAIGLFHHDTIEYLQARLPRQITLPSGIVVDGRDRELITPLVIMAQLVDLHKEEGDISVEGELYRALEEILFPEMEEELQRMKILANQLREWSESPDQVLFQVKGDICWISNKMFLSSRLMTHFGGVKDDLLNWLKSLNDGVLRDGVHISGHGTESCTGFPLDLTLNSKEFREWFSPKTATEAA